MKYVIMHNYPKGFFGTFHVGINSRTVSLEEIAAYYFWPGDVLGYFLKLCDHACAETISYNGNNIDNIEANMTADHGRHYIYLQPMSEEDCKKAGYIEMTDEWISHLRNEKYTGARTLMNGRSVLSL